MTPQELRYKNMQDDFADLTLTEAIAADNANTLMSWAYGYWAWVKNTSPSGGDRPPHKPPTP